MIYLFLADGFEEIEAIAPLDMLRRAGQEVRTVGVTGKVATGAHNVPVTCDMVLGDAAFSDDLDAVILPGGMPGTRHLDASDDVRSLVSACNEHGRLVCAICAAPSVLGHLGILEGKEATCFPGFEGELKGAALSKDPVAEDGNVITSRGAGTALLFGEAICARFVGADRAHQILLDMQYPTE